MSWLPIILAGYVVFLIAFVFWWSRRDAVDDFSDQQADWCEMPSPALGASAVADRALVFDGARSGRHPSGFDPIARGGA